MLNGNSSSFSNSNSFCDDLKARSLAPVWKWGLPVPDFGLMGQR